MENKLISRVLFGVSILIFVITFYFVYGMIANGKPSDYNPDQLGVQLLDKGDATNANYKELGLELFNQKITTLDSNISSGVGFAQVVLYIGLGLMVIFLIYGLITTAMSDFKKAIPSLIFVGVAVIAFIWAAISMGGSTEGLEDVAASAIDKTKPLNPEEFEAKKNSILSMTNFWVGGVMILFIVGFVILVVDLIKGIVRSASN